MSAKAKKPASLLLAETLDITEVTPLSSELLRLRGSDMRIDASQVRKLGAQCMQALLCASTTWTQDGTRLELIDPSPDFIQSVQAYGLDIDLFSSQEATL